MKPICSLSLDLDNLWSYLKVHGDEAWADYPSYLDVFVPRLLGFLDERNLRISVFIVGRDAAIESNRRWLRMIADAGHEICNHSHQHEPWLHLYSREEVERELTASEEAIEAATGKRPSGFRGPGFSFSPQVLESLAERGYDYDASTFPSFIGPLARAYYFRTAGLAPEERKKRGELFGSINEVFRPNKPYQWQLGEEALLEIPVTTIPLLRAPFHFSYLIYLAQKSPALARLYLGLATALCRLTRTEPSILMHPLDFLGSEDVADLSFFPGMTSDSTTKLSWMSGFFDHLERRFTLVPMGDHAAAIRARGPARRLRIA